jgi:ribosomal protein S14
MHFGETWFPSKEDSSIVGRVSEAKTVDKPKSDIEGKTVWKMVPVLLSKVPGSQDVSSQAIKPHNKDQLCGRFHGSGSGRFSVRASRRCFRDASS